MKIPQLFSSPLLRFYLVLASTVLLLALSLNQLYQLQQQQQAPSVDAGLVLDAVQKLHQHDKALSCSVDEAQSCDDSLFLVYPPGFWQGVVSPGTGSIIPLTDSSGAQMLCSVGENGELLCLNQLNWPVATPAGLDAAYLFYFLLLLLLFRISRNLFRDVEVLHQSALADIRFGKFPDFVLSRSSYLSPLAQSLRNMTNRIEQLNKFQAEMAETVCHDIKTPLARLKFISHLLQADKIEQFREQINNNAKEIESNVYEYLRLAQSGYHDNELCATQFSALPYLQQLLQPYLEHSNLSIELKADSALYIRADQQLLSRALNNLVANALRFAQSRVWVSAEIINSNTGRQLLLKVMDDGNGAQHQTAALTAALAVQQAPQPDLIEHHGLGLSIVQRVAEKHRGRFVLEQEAGQGATAALYLPL